MIIVDNRDKTDIFGSLKEGEVAYAPGLGSYIMKIIPIYSGEDMCTYNAIDLRDGDTLAMDDEDPVVRVNSKLVVGED